MGSPRLGFGNRSWPLAVIRCGDFRVTGPSGSLPWLLGGSENPWLSVPVFWRVWLYSCSYEVYFKIDDLASCLTLFRFFERLRISASGLGCVITNRIFLTDRTTHDNDFCWRLGDATHSHIRAHPYALSGTFLADTSETLSSGLQFPVDKYKTSIQNK